METGAIILPEEKDAKVLSLLQPIAIEVLTFADTQHIDAEVSKLSWRVQNIDWKNQKHRTIDLSQAGEYSSESISPESLRHFLAF